MGGFNSKLTQPHAFGRKAIKLSVNTAASAQTTPPPDGVTPFSRVFFVVLLLHVVLRCRVTRVSGGVHALIVTNARVPWICRYGATARVQLSLFLSFSSSNDRGDIFEKKYNAREGARDSAGMRRPFVAAARSDSIQFLLLRV